MTFGNLFGMAPGPEKKHKSSDPTDEPKDHKKVSKGFSATVENFSTSLEGVILPMGLRVDRINVQGTNASLRTKPFEPSLREPASVEVIVSQGDLEAFLLAKSPGGLKEFVVGLDNGHINVTATLHVIINMRGSAVCRLEIRDGNRIEAVLETGGVQGVSTKNLIQSQIDHMNPLFETSMLPFPCELTDVSIENGYIRVRGRILSLP